MCKILSNLDVAQDTIFVEANSTPKVINVAIMRKGNRSKTPAPQPGEIGHTFHYNIGFGTTNALGGIRYALLIIDREARHLYNYGLRNLAEQSLVGAVQKFIKEIGGKPSCMLADRNQKLIGGEVAKLLETPVNPTKTESNATMVSGTPDHRQSQNGLIEKASQDITSMARNWLASNHMLVVCYKVRHPSLQVYAHCL